MRPGYCRSEIAWDLGAVAPCHTLVAMIVLVTDFGTHDPYVGQMHLRLAQLAPQVPVVDLFHHAPAFAPEATAYLLPAYCREVPRGAVVVVVVDPGVGGPRAALVLEIDGRFYVGPDNGVFEMAVRRSGLSSCAALAIPATAAPSFHGRDVFAPAAAALALGRRPALVAASLTRYPAWPDDRLEVLFIDHYGNAVTGLRATPRQRALTIRGHVLERARTFTDKPPGVPFFYENANGLIEIAANQVSAAALLGLELSDPFGVLE